MAQAFEENFARRGELGASVCVIHKGERVVDLWGGCADRKTGQPWERHTMGTVFSSTKGIAAAALLMLLDRGLYELDAPVADYWPEFAEHGKGTITVRTLLCHRAGLCALDAPLTLDDLEDPAKKAAAAAAQAPLWEPGTDQGYHAVTFGLYAAELFARLSGERLGTFIEREIRGPLGIDLYLGLPRALNERVSTLYRARPRTVLTEVIPRALSGLTYEGKVYRAVMKKGTCTHRAFANPPELGLKGIHNFNTPRVRGMELAWCNGVTNARGLATLYAALLGMAGPEPLVRRTTLEPVFERQSWAEPDRVLLKRMGFAQGFVKEERHLFSPNPRSFGHPGAGGALGWADPDAELAIGYVMNQMDFRIRSPRALALCHAAYRCVAHNN